jgi:tetratricopeptide (TPR) repeat protein
VVSDRKATFFDRFGMAATALLGAVVLASIFVSGGCAGAPPKTREPGPGPQPAQRAIQEAEALIEGGAPEQLRQAIENLTLYADTEPRAAELASFAVRLFELLYPELHTAGYLEELSPAAAYEGPYGEILELAEQGEEPPGGAVALGEDFFGLAAPALFLFRIPASAGDSHGTLPAELPGYLGLARQAARVNRFSVLPLYLEGRIYELQEDFEQAASAYRESIERAASFYPARCRLADLLVARGDAEEAEALLKEGLELFPRLPSLRYSLAQAYVHSGRQEQAAAETARALIDSPENPDLLLLRARLLLDEGNWSQALRDLSLLRHQHPDKSEAYLLAARILYYRAKQDQEALELLEEAQTRFPTAAEFPELAGRILLETGRSGEAQAWLQQALDLEPQRISTLRLLLSEAIRLKRWLQAATYLSAILEQEQSPEDLLQAIRLYRNLEDDAQALYYAESLYRSYPSEASLVVYARSLLDAGEAEQAAGVVDRGLQEAQSAEARSSLYTLKALLVKDSSQEQSLKLLRDALMIDPDNLEAILAIADAYRKQGELRKASLYLKRAVELDPENSSLRGQLQRIEREANAAEP